MLGKHRATAVQAIARQQMEAAWSSKPTIDIELNLHAPKVAIPLPAAGRTQAAVTLLADLGSISLSSSHAEAASLPPEEAAIFECYSLVSSNLSVHLISGAFAWPAAAAAAAAPPPPTPGGGADGAAATPGRRTTIESYLEAGATAEPWLDHCSTSASVHVAHVSHPTLPLVRVGLQVCAVVGSFLLVFRSCVAVGRACRPRLTRPRRPSAAACRCGFCFGVFGAVLRNRVQRRGGCPECSQQAARGESPARLGHCSPGPHSPSDAALRLPQRAAAARLQALLQRRDLIRNKRLSIADILTTHTHPHRPHSARQHTQPASTPRLQVPEITLHVSPTMLTHLLRVVDTLTPATAAPHLSLIHI